MNILITGSSGLLGTALTSRLLADGHRVTHLVRADPRSGVGPVRSATAATGGAAGKGATAGTAATAGTGGTVGTVATAGAVAWQPDRGSIDREGLLRSGPFDGVVHFAGAGIGDKRWRANRKHMLLDSRIRSTDLLVGAITELDPPPSVLVSASAVGFYGDRGDEELTESSSAGSGFLADLCQHWEAAAAPAATAGVRTVLLRTGIVLSSTGGVLRRQLPLVRLGLGGRLGRGTQYRSWITLDDHVDVVLACLSDNRLTGPVNATAPHPATDDALTKALGAALHRPTVLAVPAPALRLALGAEMADELLLGGQRVLPAVLQDHGHHFRHPALEEAVRAVLGRSA